METIKSFTVDHLNLLTGLYVSRIDRVGGESVVTFDLRMTRPNEEPVMDTAAVHAIEHLGATYLRNRLDWASRMIYFGPMGCRTGFYMIVAGDCAPEDVFPLVKDMLSFIVSFEGEIPGAAAAQCGNYLDMNLSMAKYHAREYLREVFEKPDRARLSYPG
jgi:S-ribosylhomocysteine lyase